MTCLAPTAWINRRSRDPGPDNEEYWRNQHQRRPKGGFREFSSRQSQIKDSRRRFSIARPSGRNRDRLSLRGTFRLKAPLRASRYIHEPRSRQARHREVVSLPV